MVVGRGLTCLRKEGRTGCTVALYPRMSLVTFNAPGDIDFEEKALGRYFSGLWHQEGNGYCHCAKYSRKLC